MEIVNDDNDFIKINNNNFIKIDNNIVINENHIRWMKKYDDCIYICSKYDGCTNVFNKGLLTSCLNNNKENYEKLNKRFIS